MKCKGENRNHQFLAFLRSDPYMRTFTLNTAPCVALNFKMFHTNIKLAIMCIKSGIEQATIAQLNNFYALQNLFENYHLTTVQFRIYDDRENYSPRAQLSYGCKIGWIRSRLLMLIWLEKEKFPILGRNWPDSVMSTFVAFDLLYWLSFDDKKFPDRRVKITTTN